MALSGTTNTAANTALRYLGQNQGMASSSLAKLSSGSRIVKASDDAASLAVGTKVKADVTALRQASVNAAQASSLLQVADGGMARIADITQRMKALAVQSQSGSVSDAERAFVNVEFTALVDQIDDIAGQTKFNGSILLNGTAANSLALGAVTMPTGSASARLSGAAAAGAHAVVYTPADDTFTLTKPDGTTETVQVVWDAGQMVFDGSINFENAGISVSFSNMDIASGATVNATVAGGAAMSFQVGVATTDTISVSIADVRAAALGLAGATVDTAANAAVAGDAVDLAISTINATRSDLGALMSRFEFVSANLATSIENLDAARSTLMDVDMAAEMTKFTSLQVLTQAGVAMLAQANQMPQQLLRLVQG